MFFAHVRDVSPSRAQHVLEQTYNISIHWLHGLQRRSNRMAVTRTKVHVIHLRGFVCVLLVFEKMVTADFGR